MVFDGIVGSTLEIRVPAHKFFGYAFPFVAVDLVRLEESSLVQLAPETVVDFGVEVIVPSE